MERLSAPTQQDYRIERYKGFEAFHVMGMRMDEIDPAAPMLKYIAKSLKLDRDQKFWLAYLYSTCYSAATAYYMFVNLPRIQELTKTDILNWWIKHKDKLVFESDRLRVKTQNQFPRMLMNYKQLIQESESDFFNNICKGSPEQNYEHIYDYLNKKLYYFGRYSLFMYLETIYNLTDVPILATGLNLKEALSSRNGLCFLLGLDDWVRHASIHTENLTKEQYAYLQKELEKLFKNLKHKYPSVSTTYWNLETSLCAYKKLFFQTRYVGYYIDRQLEELIKMQKLAPIGAGWNLLWRFRREHFNYKVLVELNGWNGIRKERMKYFINTGHFSEYNDLPSKDYIDELQSI
ncbi:MAG: hypothetical protein IJ520_11465 [Synergistaceae bacterium]|nr:hypothetical protein [Synergistaceae bacterium]